MGRKKMTPEDLDMVLDMGFTERQIASFHDEIYKLTGSGMTLMEAFAEYCESRGIDSEDIAPLIKNDARMLADMTREANDLRLIKLEEDITPLEFEDDPA